MWLRHALSSLVALVILSACSSPDRQSVDKLNDISYAYHYRNLDSTEYYARRAYDLAIGDTTSLFASAYRDGCAEALNNLAFVSIMRMDYDGAQRCLDSLSEMTDNQVELLIADVQRMRLCQRRSANKEFHDYRERALERLQRIDEDHGRLSEHLLLRMIYAESEYAIVNSTYYYYVGLERQSIDALYAIDPGGLIQRDTAQYLNYLYNVGAGGIITEGTQQDINQQEFDCLMRCYLTASQHDYPYFIANSLEALSEHLMSDETRQQLMADNLPAMKFINPDDIPGEQLPVWMADVALSIFYDYGDVYQTAGAYRTLASCYHSMNDDMAALDMLNLALSDERINQAPDLVASIREQLSVAYSAVNDKVHSDENRNIYLDLQEQTRQDRSLQARTEMYDQESTQLNWMLGMVVVAIVLLVIMLWLFYYLHTKRSKDQSLDELLQPLREWQEENERQSTELEDHVEEINEARNLSVVHIRTNERRNLEQRAKVSLVNGIMPFIDRIVHEVERLDTGVPSANDASAEGSETSLREQRLDYIRELTEKINEYNDVLTHWIQLRQGELSLRIESFPLQQLFDIVARGKMSFSLKGIELNVQPTESMVKADRILTLFMLNTLADNARKFTDKGGHIDVAAEETDDYVEISVADTGVGMSQEQLEHLFDHKVITDNPQTSHQPSSHGFGLMNCRGIIEKYRKLSNLFSVCTIGAESEENKGSRFFFRLPKGRVMAVVCLLMSVCQQIIAQPQPLSNLDKAYIYSDSAYFSNINGNYERTLMWADSCRYYLNQHYLSQHPGSQLLMQPMGDTSLPAPEIQWFQDSVQTNYDIILVMRNESAVAALALHEWALYQYNNKVYTQLFKERSADNSLTDYCRMMQQSRTNKTIAIVILLLILAVILPAYYLLYYRHRLYYRFCVERINTINNILLTPQSAAEKLQQIEPLASADYPEELQRVVSRILQALRDSISSRQQQIVNIELAEDERRRAELENNNLHVSNSVLDNCLSTLKHETMYYPSRIRQLVDRPETDMQTIHEIVTYYRDLYSLLSQQAMRQVERVKLHLEPVTLYGETVLGDSNLLHYLFEMLTRQGEQVSVSVKDDKYLVYTVTTNLHLTDHEAQELFSPADDHITYLLCRQIVRDHSEATNRRGCGIRAEIVQGTSDSNPQQPTTIIIITLPRWNHSKSLS